MEADAPSLLSIISSDWGLPFNHPETWLWPMDTVRHGRHAWISRRQVAVAGELVLTRVLRRADLLVLSRRITLGAAVGKDA